MKFGLLYEMETPRPWHERSEYNTYWEALAQIELADGLASIMSGKSSIIFWKNTPIARRPKSSMAR